MEWSNLNNEFSEIMDSVKNEWQELMKSNEFEEKYHKFIAEHSAMCWGRNVFFTISKLRLAEKFVPDFVLIDEKGSLGLEYTLVEIEKPSTSTVTQQNNPASGLTHAQKQIRDWKHWIGRNSQEVGNLFPSKFSYESNSHIKFMLIAGRRADITHEQQAERVRIANEVGYEIRSFDFFTDNLNSFRAQDFTIPNSDIKDGLFEKGVFHDFSNPFYKSLTDSNWRKISSSPDLNRAHMIGYNVELFNGFMKTNNHFEQFKKLTKHSSRLR